MSFDFHSASLRFLVLACAPLSSVPLLAAEAEARGDGMSSLGCSGCHPSAAEPPSTALDLPSELQPGQRAALRLTIRAADIKAGGFYLQTQGGEGTFEAGPGSKLAGAGLTQTTRKSANQGAVTFDFWWTPPVAPGATRFQVSVLSSDANGSRGGDRAGDLHQDVAYGCEGVELFRDWDRDGFGHPNTVQLKCGLPEGFAAQGTDCNDNSPEVFPGAEERCNQRDDDCDTEVDEGTEQFVFYMDADGDGYGVPGMSQEFVGCAIRKGLAPNSDDCDDAVAQVYPAAIELCNRLDDNCDGEVDEGLLVTCGLGECARTPESCFDRDCVPGLPSVEICNGLDDDCDGFADDEPDLCPEGEICGLTACVPDPNPTLNTGGSGGGGGAFGSGGATAGSGGGEVGGAKPEDDGMPTAPDTPTNVMSEGAPDASVPAGPQAADAGDMSVAEPPRPVEKPVIRNPGNSGSSSGGCSVRAANADRTLGVAWTVMLGLAIAWRRRAGFVAGWRYLTGLAIALSFSGLQWGCSSEKIQNKAGGPTCNEGEPGCPSAPRVERDAGPRTTPTAVVREDGGPKSSEPPLEDGGVRGVADSGVDAAPETPCQDLCDPELVGTCVAGRVRTCWKVLDQCAVLNEADCRLGRCADDVTCAKCNDTCEQEGVAGCRNGELGQCVRDVESCLTWQAQSTCAGGFCADANACGTCQHECELSAPAECTDGNIRQCYEDGNGCRKWSTPSPCALDYCASSSSCPAGWSLGQRGGVSDDRFVAVTVDSAASIAAVGAYHDFADFEAESGTTDAYLNVKDSQDRTILTERWGSPQNDEAVDVGSIAPDDYYVAGWAEGAIGTTHHQGGRDGFVTRWRRQGNNVPEMLWTRLWGSAEHELPRALWVEKGGDVVVFGSTLGVLPAGVHFGGQDLMLGRWDAVGNQLWLKQWGTDKEDVGTDVVTTPPGSTFVVGSTSGLLGEATSHGGADAFLQKLDRDGNVEFTRTWGGPSGDAAEAIVMVPGGDLLIVGTTQGTLAGQSKGGVDLHLSRWTPSGDQVWIQQWGTTSDDRVYDLAVDSLGRIYAAAAIRAGEKDCPLGQAWLIVWDALGAPLHENLWDTCENEEFHAVAVDPSGRVALAGFTRGVFVSESKGGADAILVTYNPPPL